jgi:hypothetical protein
LKPVKYNHEDPFGNLQNLRQSLLEKSQSKKLKDLSGNPDIVNSLLPIPEEDEPKNLSAPVKTYSDENQIE